MHAKIIGGEKKGKKRMEKKDPTCYKKISNAKARKAPVRRGQKKKDGVPPKKKHIQINLGKHVKSGGCLKNRIGVQKFVLVPKRLV